MLDMGSPAEIHKVSLLIIRYGFALTDLTIIDRLDDLYLERIVLK